MNFFHLPLKHASWKKVLANKQKKTSTVIMGCFCLTKKLALWLDMFKFTFMDFFHHKNPFVGQLYSLEWPRSFTWQKSIVSFEILYHWCVMPSKWVVWKLNCRILSGLNKCMSMLRFYVFFFPLWTKHTRIFNKTCGYFLEICVRTKYF